MKYADMSIDELDAESTKLKGRVAEINEERNAIRAVRDVKVEAEHAARAAGAPDGGVKVTPATAKITKGN